MLHDPPRNDHALFQDPAFARALELCGQATRHLPTGEVLLMRRLFGGPVAMLPRATPPPDLTEQLGAIGLARTPLILSPDAPCPLPRAFCLSRPRDLIVLPLDRDNARARARLHPKWRNQLARAEKRPLQVVHGSLPPDADHPLLKLESAQGRARGYAQWPPTLTAAFAQAAPKQTLHYRAGYEDRALAHMLFLIHGRRATYHIGHITAEGRERQAHNLLMWRATRYLASMGVTSVELGLMQPRAPGLNRFKLRTGAHRRPTGGTWAYWRPFATGLAQPSTA
ncbi:MAG: GNAT family N-acetyltransferase [Sulfitobacter sp.]|nr:GNAT family N-acetyltransferase [Sulfitobacter sp.]